MTCHVGSIVAQEQRIEDFLRERKPPAPKMLRDLARELDVTSVLPANRRLPAKLPYCGPFAQINEQHHTSHFPAFAKICARSAGGSILCELHGERSRSDIGLSRSFWEKVVCVPRAERVYGRIRPRVGQTGLKGDCEVCRPTLGKLKHNGSCSTESR